MKWSCHWSWVLDPCRVRDHYLFSYGDQTARIQLSPPVTNCSIGNGCCQWAGSWPGPIVLSLCPAVLTLGEVCSCCKSLPLYKDKDSKRRICGVSGRISLQWRILENPSWGCFYQWNHADRLGLLVESEVSAFGKLLDIRDFCPPSLYYSPIHLLGYLLGSGTTVIKSQPSWSLHEAFSIMVDMNHGFSTSVVLTFCAGQCCTGVGRGRTSCEL